MFPRLHPLEFCPQIVLVGGEICPTVQPPLQPRRTLHTLCLNLLLCSKRGKAEAGVHVGVRVCVEDGRADEESERMVGCGFLKTS